MQDCREGLSEYICSKSPVLPMFSSVLLDVPPSSRLCEYWRRRRKRADQRELSLGICVGQTSEVPLDWFPRHSVRTEISYRAKLQEPEPNMQHSISPQFWLRKNTVMPIAVFCFPRLLSSESVAEASLEVTCQL
eukprot:4235402-Amphidinium_carterae.1